MTKKEIIILVIVFFSVLVISTVSVCLIMNNNQGDKPINNTSSKVELKVGDYTLVFGTYKGYESEYNVDTEKVEKKEKKFELSETKINGQFYEVRNMSLYVNGYEMYKVIANNKLELLAGEGVIFEYEKK